MGKIKVPCTRGLKGFEESGCPRRPFDELTGEGCPAWIEMAAASRDNPLKMEVRRQCVDFWQFQFHWAGMGLLEGVQQAMEETRNMTALLCLTTTGAQTPEELIRVATKNLQQSKDKLMLEASGDAMDP